VEPALFTGTISKQKITGFILAICTAAADAVALQDSDTAETNELSVLDAASVKAVH
jgi:hypothetical protein